MLSSGNDLLRLIPQRPPMVLIDSLLSCDEQYAVGSFKVPDHHLFVEDGRLLEAGLIEFMAQTAAARSGWMASQQSLPGTKPPVGVIGAIKNAIIAELPPSGSTLLCELEVMHTIGLASIVKMHVSLEGGTAVAEAELKIFLQNE